MSGGIYRIVIIRPDGDLFYIGQSVRMFQRKYDHLKTLRNRTHYNQRLQDAFDKYGEDAFQFEPILICNPDMLSIYEQAIFDFYASKFGIRSLLNIQRECVTSPFGLKRSLEVRAKLSAAKKGKPGRKWTTEQRLQLSIKKKGISPLPSTIAAIIAANTGRIHSLETREKMSRSQRNRKKISGTTRLRMSLSARKREIEKKLRGFSVSLETREKMSNSRRGHKHSQAARIKMSIAAIQREERVRDIQFGGDIQ